VTRFLAALRRFFRWFTVDAEVVRFLRGRGEVADAPGCVESMTFQACPVNHTPHWCCEPPYGWELDADQFLAEIERYLKEQA
jgi:hypothetical protein